MKYRVMALLTAAMLLTLLCALLAASLTGCGSLLDREWYEVKDHSSSYYESEQKDVLQPETYQDLVNALLVLVDDHAAEGTIWLSPGSEALDPEQAIEQIKSISAHLF